MTKCSRCGEFSIFKAGLCGYCLMEAENEMRKVLGEINGLKIEESGVVIPDEQT